MEEYRIVLESQLGPREGSLLLEERGNGVLVGSITLLGVENSVQGERKDKNFIRLSHHLRTQVSDLECISVFRLEGDRLSGTLQSSKCTMLWRGEKVTAGKGGFRKNAGE